jgi:hypothetical protein
MRNASFIEVEIYHIGFATAAVRLLFFSGCLLVGNACLLRATARRTPIDMKRKSFRPDSVCGF